MFEPLVILGISGACFVIGLLAGMRQGESETRDELIGYFAAAHSWAEKLRDREKALDQRQKELHGGGSSS